MPLDYLVSLIFSYSCGGQTPVACVYEFVIVIVCSMLMFLFLDLIPVPNPKKAYRRIARTCPFCDKSESRLSRHIATVHQVEPKVKKLLCLPKALRRKQLALLRNEGLAKKNLGMNTDLEPIKKSDAEKVTCQSCLGVYSKKKFYLHAKSCPGAKKIRTSLVPMLGNLDGFTDILNSFHEDEIGEICRTDDTIITEEFYGTRIKPK